MSGRYSQTLHVWFIDDRLLGAAMHEGPVTEPRPEATP